MKKVLIFIVTLLALCSYSANAVENEEYEVIAVQHNRTEKWLVVDTLFSDDIIYTEQKAVNYAASRIPEKFVDTSEEYIVYNLYFVGEKKTKYVYRLWYTGLGFYTKYWKYELIP